MRYYYDKYNLRTVYGQSRSGPTIYPGYTSISGYPGFSCASDENHLWVYGNIISLFTPNEIGTVFQGGSYNDHSTSVNQYDLHSNGDLYCYIWTAMAGYGKGSYIETVTATDGTYPDDGVSGSYWYVKTIPMVMRVKINGAWKDTATPKIKVGGAWKVIAAMKIKVAGAWEMIF